MSEQGIEHTRQ